MTASMPQPEKMTAADYREIADFLDVEAMRAKLDGWIELSVDIRTTATHLRSKAYQLEGKS